VRHRLGLLALVLSIGTHFACSASDGSSLSEDDGSGVGGSAAGGDDGLGGGFSGSGGSTGSGNICNSGADDDFDGDGFTFNQGDCNDCDANVNPDAVEVQTPMDGNSPEPADENCNGEIDEAPATCDSGLALDDSDAMNAAKAIDICQVAGEETVWGVVSAAYVRANGSPVTASPAHGLLTDFGSATPQLGDAMLGISSGNARDASDPDACTTQSCNHSGPGTPPPGFPQDVPGCDGASDINDDIGLELELRAPSNAKGYSFDFAFTSFEFPEWVCTSYNDQFIALVEPAPMGSINGNISFDSQTNPVSVNLALFDHCDPAGIGSYASLCYQNCPSPPNPYCPLGPGFMNGSGFNEWGDSGSTGWLVTTAPVNPNETFKIRFAIWDTGDSALDSTALIDHFTWTAEPGTVGTEPIPNPK
jgi:hypothetical protein